MSWNEQIKKLEAVGVSYIDAMALRRIAMTLHRWHELECGNGNDHASWSLERDEDTDRPFIVTHLHSGKISRYPIPDREKGALRRLATIMARYPHLNSYVQSDPRGASVYVLRPGDVPTGKSAESYYSRGVALYK